MNKAEVVQVLASSFYDYPVMKFVLRSVADQYTEHLNHLVGFFCEIRLLRDWPVLGLRDEDGSLVGAALVNEPVERLLELPDSELQKLRLNIGNDGFQRLVAYEEQSSKGEPELPHHFLGMIGVDPRHQGKGYSGYLLKAVAQMCIDNPLSTGVCLSTENPGNVRLYEHFGYRVISEADVDDLHSWCMFLSKQDALRLQAL